jgi:hypothetical protein
LGAEGRPQGLKSVLIPADLRGAKAPLFHGATHGTTRMHFFPQPGTEDLIEF